MNIFQKAITAGYSCMPCNWEKKPRLSKWKQYMNKPATMSIAETWNGNIAIICGRVSGGLTCIDFDIKNGDKFDDWILNVNNITPSLLGKLFMENTPSGGYHVCYRSKSIIKNRKLARNREGKATIETRGEGGYFVCSPSKGYKVYFGKLSNLSIINDEEEATILGVAEAFDEYEKEKYKPRHGNEITGDSVFNRYDSITNPIPILQSHGWSVVYSRGDRVYLRRPGKGKGVSASWNVIPNRFYCFSTSTKFRPETVYKASAVYTFLEHDGNFKMAYKALVNS